MSTQSKEISWYAKDTGCADQSLIIDEKTGANVAVVYDRANAPIIETACNCHSDLLGALEAIYEAGRMSPSRRAKYCAEIAIAAINKAQR